MRRKKLHPLRLIDVAEYLWKPSSGCQERWQCWWVTSAGVTSAGADFYEHDVQVLVHRWGKCRASGGHCDKKWCFVAENLLCEILVSCSLYLSYF